MKDPNLFLVSAPSGAGKSSLINVVLERADNCNLPLELSISYTTREPRKGETDSHQYFFISEEDFLHKKNSDFFLEYAEVHGNWYGTSVDLVQSKLNAGTNLILEIDVQGFRQINNLSFNYESIFILPPSISSLEERIKRRGDEDIEAIDLRLKNSKDELAYAVLTPEDAPNKVVKSISHGQGEVNFFKARWEDMPTQYTIINAFADLEKIKYLDATITETIGAKDISYQRILL